MEAARGPFISCGLRVGLRVDGTLWNRTLISPLIYSKISNCFYPLLSRTIMGTFSAMGEQTRLVCVMHFMAPTGRTSLKVFRKRVPDCIGLIFMLAFNASVYVYYQGIHLQTRYVLVLTHSRV